MSCEPSSRLRRGAIGCSPVPWAAVGSRAQRDNECQQRIAFLFNPGDFIQLMRGVRSGRCRVAQHNHGRVSGQMRAPPPPCLRLAPVDGAKTGVLALRITSLGHCLHQSFDLREHEAGKPSSASFAPWVKRRGEQHVATRLRCATLRTFARGGWQRHRLPNWRIVLH